jgi:hypothetical protein
MIRRFWLGVPLAAALVVGLTGGVGIAADRTKVDQATRRVEQGARQIGQGEVGSGFVEMFTGIGYTIVEGAKFSGNTIAEFFTRTFRKSEASGARTDPRAP